MSARHFAEVELDDDGDALSVRFVCTGGPEDLCRRWCAEGCEEWCAAPAINKDPEEGGHRWADTGSCRIVDWLDAVGWQDTGWVDEPGAGGDREVTAADLRPGRHLIADEWTGDDYIWRYAEEPAVTGADR